MKTLKVILICIALTLAGSVAATYAASVTPETVKGWFDLAFVPIMWAIGALYAKIPSLRNLPNAAIPWLNLAVYILGRLVFPGVVPNVEAGVLDALRSVGTPVFLAAKGAATSVLASILWDKFLGSPIGKIVPNQKPDPNAFWLRAR